MVKVLFIGQMERYTKVTGSMESNMVKAKCIIKRKRIKFKKGFGKMAKELNGLRIRRKNDAVIYINY